jgi:flavin-dependent dehydrogenase
MRLSFDVFVGGGGVAGVCAAIAAARAGARTLLVERNGFLGGATTAGAVNQFIGWQTAAGKQVVAGIGQEIIDRLKARGAGTDIQAWRMSTGLRMDRVEFDPEVLKVVLDELILEAGVTPLFNTWLFNVERQQSVITKVRLLSKSGEIVVRPASLSTRRAISIC